MDTNDIKSKHKNRLKLSLKKNRQNQVNETKKMNRSSDVITLDESFDRLVLNLTKNVQSTPKLYSPIVIQDSSLEESLPKIMLSVNESCKDDKGNTPSKSGNIFQCTTEDTTPDKQSEPSYYGWSPAQNIITTPKHDPTPSTPKENANKSVEYCTIPKIQKSQIKLLNDLYGDVWKSIPKLFKTMTPSKANFDECTRKLNFDDENKENIKYDLKLTKELLLMTESDTKKQLETLTDTEKKSRRKLYTEKVPDILELPKPRVDDVKSTTKKLKVKENDLHNNKESFLTKSDTKKWSELLTDVEKKSKKKLFMENVTSTSKILKPRVKNVINTKKELKVTEERSAIELVISDTDVAKSVKKQESVKIRTHDDYRLSFMASLADDVPSWRCDIAAIQYRDNFHKLKEKLTRRLFAKFNKYVFNDGLHAKMPIIWDTKFRSTAGTATNRRVKTPNGDLRVSSIKLSTKVVDSPQRLRDTLIHELCHAATWVIDGELKAGHGPLWKKWAARSLKVFPELGEISRCHDMLIHFKYSYRCTRCGLCYQRHSKSIDTSMKRCGGCRGTLELLINKKTKDGVVSTPARKGNTNGFALYVKENYAAVKDGKTHAQVMKILGEEFSAKKIKPL